MKVAVSATGASLDAEVDPRLGRCSYFLLVDTETMDFEAVENTSGGAAGGAGISAAQMIANKGIQAVLTGNCGPNAYQVLSTAGIEIITGVSGTVRNAINSYKAGDLRACRQGLLSTGAGFGMWSRMGRGRGIGMGRGVGRRMMPPAAPPSDTGLKEQDLQALKEQSQVLFQQLAEIQRRIDELQKKKQ
jgi:predicted Fe-Mo cluster-binding NifX family protein